MKKTLWLSIAMAGLLFAPLFAADNERAGFVLFFDAGVPVKGAEGRYGADFGKTFLGLAAQARLAGNFMRSAAWLTSPSRVPAMNFSTTATAWNWRWTGFGNSCQ